MCKSIGLELALCCDFILGSDDKSTIFGFCDSKLGSIPASGGCFHLSRKIGLIQSIKMIILGRYYNSEESKKKGLIHSIIPFNSDFFQNVRIFSLTSHKQKELLKGNCEYLLEDNVIGRLILEKKMKNLIDSFVKGKFQIPYTLLDVMMFCYTNDFIKSSEYTMNSFIETILSKETKNLLMLRIMLNQTQKINNICSPKFVKKIDRVSVIGAGELGSEVALLSGLKGFKTYLKDSDEKLINESMSNIQLELENLKSEKKLSNEEIKKILSNISTELSFDNLKDTQVVIECGPELIENKTEILQKVQEKLPNCIYAICTYNYPIGLISSSWKNKENIVGLSFFKPFLKMHFVELVKTSWTSTSTIGTMYQLLLSMGKIPIIVKDSPGFLTPRLVKI
jgi:3-hydroxyacyl-CoA dehydrogenase / enoyl-CoA hydratase / 3-hydroxybutyryl-CoA epimerase